MNKLKELINKLCPNGVEYKKLEDCCNILDNERKPVTKSARIKGEYPYYGANGIQDYVSDYIFDGTFVLVGEDGSVINKNGNPVVTWAEGKIWVNNHAHVIKEKENVLLRYLYHYIQTINVSVLIHGNIPKLNQGDFRNLRIAVPPLEVQCEIVHILDDFTLLSAELSAELKARQKQFAYFEEKLLFNNNFEKVKLADLCIVNQGLQIPINQRKKKPAENRYFYITVQFLKGGDEKYYIESPQQNVICKKEDILVTRTGSTGKIITGVEGCFHNNFFKVEPNERILKRYLYFVLNSKRMYNKMIRAASGGTVPDLPHKKFYNLEIFLPSTDEQKKIINVLERFEKLCNDISEGLPAEIEARQKQYEYYRDKLLTFKELKVNE